MSLSGEQRLIMHSARRFAQETLLPKSEIWAREHKIPPEVFQEMAGLGFLGMLVPANWQGSEIGYSGYALVVEEIAAADASCSTVLSVHNSMACLPILQFGNADQKERYLSKLSSGKMLGAFCLTEPSAGSDASGIAMKAVEQGDHYILNGTKQFITYGKSADLAIVFAKTNPEAGKKGITAFIVPTMSEGYNIARVEDKMGQEAAEAAQITLDNVKVPKANRLGEEGQGYKIALTNLEAGRIGIAAQCVGIARHALEVSLAYAKDRSTFGRPIIEHQAVGFRLADMATQLEAARHLVLAAAELRDENVPCLKEAAMAKLYASEMAEKVCREAIQVHGGYGYLKDFPVERLYRDVRVTTLYEGTSDIQRLIISRELAKSD